jgi:hypothetical protein
MKSEEHQARTEQTSSVQRSGYQPAMNPHYKPPG